MFYSSTSSSSRLCTLLCLILPNLYIYFIIISLLLQLQQTWSAMLQMLPLMSKDKAQTLIAQSNFSCPQHLLRHIHHNTDPEIAQLSNEQKKLLLQNAFGARKSGKNGVVVSKQVKLSKHVYNLVTSMEPEELISKV